MLQSPACHVAQAERYTEGFRAVPGHDLIIMMYLDTEMMDVISHHRAHRARMDSNANKSACPRYRGTVGARNIENVRMRGHRLLFDLSLRT